MTHMNKIRMKRAQDICAEVLNMPRGKPHEETGRVSMDHKQYRQYARKLEAEKKKTRAASMRAEKAERRAGELDRALAGERQARGDETARADQAETDRDRYKAEYEKLGQLNKDIRAEMKATEQARKEDYQAWKKELNDKEKSFQEKEAAGRQLIDQLRARAESAEQSRDQEKDRADRAEAAPQMIMGAVPFNITRIRLPKAGMIERAGSYREKAQARVDRAMQDRKHQMQKLAEDAARNEVAAELNQARRDNETAAARNAALESELETEKLNTEAVRIDLHNTQETNRTLANQVAVLKDEKEELDEKYQALEKSFNKLYEMFRPLIKLWNLLIEKRADPKPWLDGVVKFGEEVVNEALRAVQKKEQPRTRQAPRASQEYDGPELGD